jgi:hypothetical protein
MTSARPDAAGRLGTVASSESERRVGLNEATFREINEGVRGDRPGGLLSFRCECGRLGCNRLIALSRSAYEAVRADSRWFLLIPGHELVEFERVVEHRDGYAVVEKHESAADIAERSDPRRALHEAGGSP